jgi:hypothetical protein
MTCNQCGCHWCWVCGYGNEMSSGVSIEDHLVDEHGGIFDPNVQE